MNENMYVSVCLCVIYLIIVLGFFVLSVCRMNILFNNSSSESKKKEDGNGREKIWFSFD